MDNNIKTLRSNLFKDLINLKELDLSNNKIRSLPQGIFSSLTMLTKLKMDKNKLKELHPNQFQGLVKLSDLYLSDNKLQDLPQRIFKGLKKLLSINIVDNMLPSVSTETFDDVPDLVFLFMQRNEMSHLPNGFFKNLKKILRVSVDTNLMCCHLHKEDADCSYTFTDNFANCESMFKNPAPRKSIWVIGIFSLVGAAFVITWRMIFKEKNVVQSIMLLHLAVSDGLMGVYLITVGAKDLLWSGKYYLQDFEWRSGLSCQIIGAISLLSSEVSVMMMTLISADRLKNIVFPYQGASLKPKKTHILCFVIWAIGFLIAFLPMFGIPYFTDPYRYHSYYGRSVVCLPLQLTSDLPAGWEYSVAIFVALNFAFFLFIMVAYVMILVKSYLSSRRLARQGTAREIQARASSANFKRETALAKRVFFIILTDCLCWMPVIVIGLKSIIEKPFKAPGDLAVWIAVFALPINSALNPILYTLSTEQVRGILGNKMGKLWNYLKTIFFCCRRDQEGQGEGGEQNQHGIEDNEQHGGEGGGAGAEIIELAPVCVPPPPQGGAGAEIIELAPLCVPPPPQGGVHAEIIEVAPVGLPHPDEEQGGRDLELSVSVARGEVHKRGSSRRRMPVALSKKRKKSLKAGDAQLELSSAKTDGRNEQDLQSAECHQLIHQSCSPSTSKAAFGEQLDLCETAL